MDLDANRKDAFLEGMARCWEKSENMMLWAREEFFSPDELRDSFIQDLIVSTAYDLQAGSYVRRVTEQSVSQEKWGAQLAQVLDEYVGQSHSMLEVGVGEATTLSAVLGRLSSFPAEVWGTDVSFARLAVGQEYLQKLGFEARLFMSDMFNLPVEDNSVDLVFTSHALESNKGRELQAIAELLRVARRWVVLIEPIYELSSGPQQERMRRLGYVENLKHNAEKLGPAVLDYRLLDYAVNPTNASGVLVLAKTEQRTGLDASRQLERDFICPVSGESLTRDADLMLAKSGHAYPVVREIPILHRQHRLGFPRPASGSN